MVSQDKTSNKAKLERQTKGASILFVMVDGVGDRMCKNPSNTEGPLLTPLQLAKIPNMDFLASQNIFGLHDPVSQGLACGSDTAHMSIFGYDPMKLYDGRGSFEAMGAGQEMISGDIAFKSNFAFMDENKIVTKRRVDRTFPEWGKPLCDAINDIQVEGFAEHRIFCKWATEHRCGIVIQGPRLSSKITGTDPLKDNLQLIDCKAWEESNEDAVFCANVVNAASETITKKLLEHPIVKERRSQGKTWPNLVLLRGASQIITVDPFIKKHGLKSFMVAPTAIIRGVGLTCGIEILGDKEVPNMTGYYDSNLEGKMLFAADQVDDYDFGFVHIKAIDDAGHDKDFSRKVEQLEKTDRALGKLLEKLKAKNRQTVICITGDHTTPVKYGDHTHEPVPICVGLAFTDPNKAKEQNSIKFDELTCASGVLGRFGGNQIIPLLKQVRDKVDQLY